MTPETISTGFLKFRQSPAGVHSPRQYLVKCLTYVGRKEFKSRRKERKSATNTHHGYTTPLHPSLHVLPAGSVIHARRWSRANAETFSRD